MNLTSKSRYALKIMVDLAYYRTSPLVRRGEIARRQGIPPDYLDQIMIRLRGSKLVESVRGRGGGYRLARDPETITLWDVFGAVEDTMYPVECVGSQHVCDFETSCVTHAAWNEIFIAMKEPLVRMTLGSLAARWGDEHRMCPVGGIRECKGGRVSSAAH